MPYQPAPWMMIPFGVLLALIALGPIWFPNWWLKHYPKAALGLGAISIGYYLFFLPSPAQSTVWHTLQHYAGFISLVGALYVVSGGIHIRVRGEATPLGNVLFLFLGAVLSNFLGTTGASMLLIRPWIRVNRYRITQFHVVFFIFIISNVGGCLTPIGDPPLFIGYLLGVPFWWVAVHAWSYWLVGVGILLGIFYILDRRNYHRAPQVVRDKLAEPPDQWRIRGLTNLFFLGVILGAVFLNSPLFLRETLMLAAALGSYFTTRREVHQANHFDFHPIREVAILFIGIFATMMPALDWLQHNAHQLGQPTPTTYYWGTGLLSAWLDNAPTYLSFLTAIFGNLDREVIHQVQSIIAAGSTDLQPMTGPNAAAIQSTLAALKQFHPKDLASHQVGLEQIEIAFLVGNHAYNSLLVAVSIGAVFFGACTYIGNGPNFMVKSIAEQQKVHVPNFLAYIVKFSLPIMGPMLFIVWWYFLRG